MRVQLEQRFLEKLFERKLHEKNWQSFNGGSWIFTDYENLQLKIFSFTKLPKSFTTIKKKKKK